MSNTILPDWQRAFGAPVFSCKIRNDNADFQVNEQLGFELSGDGEHDYLKIEKQGANTSWVARGLAAYAGIAESDVGYAGMKDRHAVTTQWFSVRRPAGNKAEWRNLELEGVRILEESRHRRKLRRGAHTGNTFCIALRNVAEIGNGLHERLNAIKDRGVPNYFGEQRFGRDGGNLDLARDFFAGKRLKRGKRSIAMSAARSFLFNRILEDRISVGTWNTLLVGDCANLDGSGSIFRVDQVDDELRHRCAALDVHPSGALWGAGDLQTDGKVAEFEKSVVNGHPELARGLEKKSASMARRALRLAVREFSWQQEADTLWLRFFLVRGGYATAVLREIASYDSAGTDSTESVAN